MHLGTVHQFGVYFKGNYVKSINMNMKPLKCLNPNAAQFKLIKLKTTCFLVCSAYKADKKP